MKKNSKIGWVEDYSNELDNRTKKFLGKILKSTNVLKPDTIVVFLSSFIRYTKKYKNMVIWFKPKSSYVLIITPNKVKLAKDYKEVILEGSKNKRGIITLIDEKTIGEGLGVVRSLFKKILEIKKPELLKI